MQPIPSSTPHSDSCAADELVGSVYVVNCILYLSLFEGEQLMS